MTTQNPTTAPPVTLEEFAALPEYPRYELVAGVLLELPMAESGEHEETAALVIWRMFDYVLSNDLGVVLGSNYGYVTIKDSPATCRNADASFISSKRRQQTGLFGMLYDGSPDLAVEILSYHPVDLEIPQKISEYLAAGSKAVWVIDTNARTLTIHTADAPPLTLTDADTVTGGDYLPGFACPVSDLLPRRRS